MLYETREIKMPEGKKAFELTPWVFDPQTHTINWSWSVLLQIKWRRLTGKPVASNDPKDLN